MAGFIFGGDTGMTYEQVQRNRKIADQLMAGSGRSRNVGEGIGSFAKQISGALIGRKADKRDDALRAESEDLWNTTFGGGFNGGGSSAATPPPYSAAPPPVSTAPLPTEGDLLGNDAMAAIGRTPNNPTDAAGRIRAGLTERGLPPHVADAFVMNFQDESGLDAGINEIEPTVPGSRGGFGLAQWTGPRRRELEAFAQQRGMPVNDENLQMDFLMQELQGSESNAAQNIMSSRDAPTAAAAIVNDFLRPAEVNRAKREAQYTGGAPTTQGGQGGGPNVSTQQIVELLSNPYIRQDPAKSAVLQSLLQQNMQGQDPMRALEMERAQLELEALRNPQADPWANTQVINDQIVTMQNGQPQVIADLADPPKPEVPTTKNVTLDDGSEVLVQWNPETRVWDPAPIPEGGTTGSGGNPNLTEGQSKLTLFQTLQTETQPVLLSLEEQFNPANLGDPAKARIPIAGNYFTSPEYQMYQTAASAWAEGALRIATGAAATQPEIERNIKTYFAQPGDTPQTVAFKAQMREMYSRAVNNALGAPSDGGSLHIPTPEAFAEQVGGPDAGGDTDAANVPEGIDPAIWAVMTPEEKALWQN